MQENYLEGEKSHLYRMAYIGIRNKNTSGIAIMYYNLAFYSKNSNILDRIKEELDRVNEERKGYTHYLSRLENF